MDKFEAITEDLKNNRQPQICNCYNVTKELHYLSEFELLADWNKWKKNHDIK